MTLSLLRSANMVLLILYPAAWLAPLATAGVLPWFSGNEITIIRGVSDLWAVDAALAALVALFAVVIPYLKTLAISAIHFGYLGRRALPLIETIGKLSMADVFLIALYIVVVKGVGIGSVQTAWGLWLFTACVLASIAIGWATKSALNGATQPAVEGPR
ncbi:MAG: paraquat-inducible protein A [Paracoccaceae bacterium]